MLSKMESDCVSGSLCMQEDIVEECRKHGIAITAYSPLGSDKAPLLENAVVKRLSEKHGVAPSNILISLQANRPSVTGKFMCAPGSTAIHSHPTRPVIPKSVTPHRIDENATIVDLTEEDVKELAAIEKENHNRFCKPYWTGWGNIGFPDLD